MRPFRGPLAEKGWWELEVKTSGSRGPGVEPGFHSGSAWRDGGAPGSVLPPRHLLLGLREVHGQRRAAPGPRAGAGRGRASGLSVQQANLPGPPRCPVPEHTPLPPPGGPMRGGRGCRGPARPAGSLLREPAHESPGTTDGCAVDGPHLGSTVREH